MTEAQWALVQMLDGVQRHDLPNQLGLPDDEIDRIWSAYESARTALAQPKPPAEDGPAVPESREPASVIGQPSDEGLMELMPQRFRDDLATVSRLASYGTPVEPGIYRVSLNTGALDFARAVLARWGHHPAPPAEGEVGELVNSLRHSGDALRAYCLHGGANDCTRAADLLEQRHPAPVPVAIPGEEYHEDMGAVTWWRFPVDEPPWVGTPNDSDWPGYHTHFTPAPPEPATALPLPAEEVQP